MNKPHATIICRIDEGKNKVIAEILYSGEFQKVTGRYFYLDDCFCLSTENLTAEKAHVYISRTCQIFEKLKSVFQIAENFLNMAKNDCLNLKPAAHASSN